jgi:hypothetical protein
MQRWTRSNPAAARCPAAVCGAAPASRPLIRKDIMESNVMSNEDQIHALEKQVAELANRIGMLEDEHAVRCLQYAYGYYLDKCLYDEVVDLFAEDGEVRFLGGIFRSKKSVHRLYCDRFRANFTNGRNGPVHGFLLDHPMFQEIIHVTPDRKLAHARIRCLMQAGRHETAIDEKHPLRQWFEGGQYENVYVKEDGVWKIKVLNYHPVWHGDFDTGWAHTRPNYVPFYEAKDLFPGNPIGPDALEDPMPVLWPDVDVVPFHYPHPVTGKWVKVPVGKAARL